MSKIETDIPSINQFNSQSQLPSQQMFHRQEMDQQEQQSQIQVSSDQNNEERDRFNNQFEYILTILGFSAGFGSVWRFPYLIYKNGGGVFLIPYAIMLLLIGIPSFYFETSLGQMLQKGPPQCFQFIHKKYKGLGIFPLVTSFCLSSYYNLILAYSFYYLYQSFVSPLPWTIAPDSLFPWNTDYFYKDVLQFSDSIDHFGNIIWPLLFCYVLSMIFVYLCIQKGVSVSGKVVLITATSPYLLLVILLLRGLFLEGAFEGLSYLFMPDWSKLFSLQVWVDATNQAIFQMSVGGGALILFGSYRPIQQEIKKSAFYIPFLTILCGFLASMVIFSYMGYMSAITNIPIDEIPLRGPDLTFIVFPAILTKMPFSNLWAIIFFITMIFLGIDTQFGFIDGLAGTIEDEIKGESFELFGITIQKKQIRGILCILMSLLSLLYCSQAGFYYLDLIDSYSVGLNLIIGIFFETFFFAWISKWDLIEERIKFYIKDSTPEFLIMAIKYSIPFFTAALSIMSLYLQLTKLFDLTWWCTLLGWTLTISPYYIIYYYYNKHKDDPEDYSYEQKLLSHGQNYKTNQSGQEMIEFLNVKKI